MNDIDEYLWKTSGVFAPDYPRQSSSHLTIQAKRHNRSKFCSALSRAVDNGMPGYYSVYSFPRGHSQDGNIPKVDCIFIDLDVEGGNYVPNEGKTDYDDWKIDMSALLARARMIADAILAAGEEDRFRVVLSGHKGLHLYLDFPTIAPNNGDFQQFKNGLKEYGEQVVSGLDSTVGGVNIERWVDVDASDLGRLARFPNTIHHDAAYDDETRWCVPITVNELSHLHVEDYLRLTRGPRWLDSFERIPSESAGKKVVQSIRTAPKEEQTVERGSTFDPAAIARYDEQANDDITIEDIPFLTSNKPCIEAFQNRDDAFNHGNASHIMEMSIVGNFVELGVPRDVIHEFFADIPGYDEDVTEEQINKILGRDYGEFNCSKIASKAGQFCLGNDCSVYARSDDVQK